MNSVPTNSTTSPDETIHSPSSSTHHQPAQNTVAPTLLDSSFPDVPMNFDFESLNPGVDAPLAPASQVPPHPVNGGPQNHVLPETPLAATHHALPQPITPSTVPPGILHPLTLGTYDGAYPLYLFTYPNTAPVPLLASPSAAVFDPGDRASLSNTMNPSIPMASLAAPLMAPARESSSSLTGMNPEPERAPVSGLRMGVPAGMSTVPPENANAASTVTAGGPAAATTSTAAAAFAGVGGARAPISRCSFCHRVNPLIRVDDTIEWVRPGVMKMVVWFNWTSNVEAEAEGSWEP